MAGQVYDWVEILDPKTGQVLYANPTTGQCQWETKPTSGTIKPLNPDGDWWELWDEKLRLPYYYHSKKGSTQWEKPSLTEENFISLAQVQHLQNTRLSFIKEPPSPSSSRDSKRYSRSLDLPPPNNGRRTQQQQQEPTPTRSTSDQDSLFNFRNPLRKGSSASIETTSTTRRPSQFSIFAQFTRSRTSSSNGGGAAEDGGGGGSSSGGRQVGGGTRFLSADSRSLRVSAPIENPEARAAMHPLNNNNNNNTSSPTMSERRIALPSSLQQDINQFAIDGFAQKYFATHKRGLFRRRVPVKEMLQWSKESINKPLIMLNKDLYKDALKCFKMIQTVMGDRSRPRNTSDIEDLQSILSCGITKGQMRDEIYVQICKQLNNNPRGNSIKKGWEILCVVCITFPPSKNLESYLHNFVRQHHQVKENDVDVMSRHVSAKLKRICIRGAKGKVLTAAEIERAKEAPFKPSVFGETLEFIMNLDQEKEQTSLQIPQIVPFLADAVLALNGQRSEGIFRIAGDADDVTELRVRIENGRYDATGITDPNVPASLLKYWIRDLPEPLITAEHYDSCIEAAEDADRAIQIINSLPTLNRRIVLYILRFLQEFIDPDVIKHTLMNVQNLAMVFAPNLLRCPSEKLTTVLENSKYEQAFLRTLLLEMEADKNVCAFDADGEHAVGRRKAA